MRTGSRTGIATLTMSAALACAQLLVAAGYAIAARSAGPADLGAVLVPIALGTVLAGVADFGLAALLTRELAARRIAPADAGRRLIDRAVLVTLAAGGIAAIVAAVEPQLALFAASAAAVGVATLAVQSAQVPLRGSGRMKTVAVLQVADKVVFAVVVVVAAAFAVPVAIGLPLAMVAGLAAEAISCAVAGARSRLPALVGAALVTTGPRRWARSWWGVRGFGLASVVSVAQQLDVPLLASFGGPATAGVYGAVGRWTTPLLLPASALAQVGVAAASAASSTREAFLDLRKAVWLLVAAFGASVLVAVLAQPVTVLVLGPAFAASAPVLAVLAIATLPTLAAQPLVMIMESRRRENPVAAILAASLIVRLGAIVALAPVFGALAAAWGVLGQQALTAVLVGVLAYRTLRSEVAREAIA